MKNKLIYLSVFTIILLVSFLFNGASCKAETILTYWTPETRSAPTKLRNEMWIPQFEEAHPGVKVKVVTVPWNEIAQKIQQAFVTNSLPDVLYGQLLYIKTFYQQGIIQSVTDLVKEIGEEEFDEGVKNIHTVDGEWITVPWILVTHQLFYRSDWYEEAGLTPPHTWQEWLDSSKKLTKDTDSDGKIDQYGILAFMKYQDGEKFLFNLLASNDAFFFDKNGNVIINSERTIETLKFLETLRDNVIQPGAVVTNEQDARMLFADGLGASIITSASIIDILNSKAPELIQKIGSVPIPVNKGSHNWVWYGSLCVSSTTKNAKLAKEFIKVLYTGDNYTNYFINTVMGHLPLMKSTVQSTLFWDSDRLSPIKHLLEPGMASTKTGIMAYEGSGSNPYAGLLYGEGVITEMGQKILTGSSTPEEVAAWAEKRVKEIVADSGL